MRLILLTLLLCLVSLVFPIAYGQERSDYLVLRGKVGKIEETMLEGSDDAWHLVQYKVLKVCAGDYDGTQITVAHLVGTAKGLKVGDVVCRRLKRTDEFREMARIGLEAFGERTPEDMIADFVFAGYKQPCSCSNTK